MRNKQYHITLYSQDGSAYSFWKKSDAKEKYKELKQIMKSDQKLVIEEVDIVTKILTEKDLLTH